MKALNEKQWAKFRIGDYFDVVLSKGDNQPRNLKSGKLPLVSAGETNNGLATFILTGDGKSEIFSKNTITFDMFGNVFVQPYDYYAVSHGRVNICIPKVDLSFLTLQFLATIFDREKVRFSYNNACYSSVVARLEVLLPTDDSGSPDWVYMAGYMKQRQDQMISKYEKYLSTLKTVVKKTIAEPARWVEFKIGDLFELFQGRSKGLNHLQENKKGVNYLGATNQNNGVLAQVSPEPKQMQSGNCIAFIRNGEGSMGYAVYKAEDFIATSDITVGYNNNLNRYTGQYIVSVADQVRGKYNFGYKRSGARLVKETLLLPATEDGHPDWVYMEAIERERES